MKIYTSILPILCVGLFRAGLVCAQEPSAPKQDTDMRLLKKQMLEMQACIEQMQTQHQQEIGALKTRIESQQKTIADIQKTGGAPPLPAKAGEPLPGTPLFPTTDESIVVGTPPPATPGAGVAPAFPTTDAAVTAVPGPSSLTGPITLAGGGKNYLNISLDGLFTGAASTERDFERLQPGGHDPSQRGFTVQNVELTLQGAVDPYFDAFATIIYLLDRKGESVIELEEAWMQTTTLPFGLQVKAGQFLSPFGRQNQIHPHAYDFADTSLVNGRLLGPDGMRSAGVQVSWLAPLPWFSEFTVAAQNGNGETGYLFRNRGDDDLFYNRETLDRNLRGPQDLTYVTRWTNSFDLTATQTLLMGVSGAFGPNNTGSSTRTQLYGADIFYKWKSPRSEGGFPFVKWQTEGMLARFEAGEGAAGDAPRETFNDWGAYSQVLWGFRKGWVAGLRGDFLNFEESTFTDDPTRQDRWRVSANLTWYPTEFSKIRLQYNHDLFEANRTLGRQAADSIFLQFEFILGAHAAHKF